MDLRGPAVGPAWIPERAPAHYRMRGVRREIICISDQPIHYMNKEILELAKESLVHNRDIKKTLDQKASLLLGLSGVILTISIGNLEKVQYVILAVTALVVIFLSILAVFLPFRSKKRIKPNLICQWGTRGAEFDEYRAKVLGLSDSPEKILDEYLKEAWNLSGFSVKSKTCLLKWASGILLAGFLTGFVLVFV